MNDYEMMNQRVDQLREELGRLNHKQTVLDSLKADVMAELLDTRRQITRADIIAKRILGRQPEIRPLAPVDYLDV